MNEASDRQDDIDAAAATWAARLGGGPLSEAERRDLDEWLGRSPLHRATFDEARAAWDKMGQLRFAPGALAKSATPLRRPAGTAWSPGIQKRKRRRAWLQAAPLAACLLLLIGAASFWLGDPQILLMADYRTAPGAQQTVTLSDGSTVDLGPASAIAVHYSDAERRIELLSGVAYFAAAPMAGAEQRPFVVAAADGTSRALGTRFVVDRIAGAVEVTVIEHEVEVALSTADHERPRVIVAPGRSVRYAGAGLGEIRSVNPDHALAWRRGRLIFDHMPLGEVVAELNRYRRGRIVITDSALASRQVSGVFDMSDPQAALATIARDLHIGATSLPPLVTLLH